MVSLCLLGDPKRERGKISDEWKDIPYLSKSFFCSHGVFVSGELLSCLIPRALQLLFLVFGGVQSSRVHHTPCNQYHHGQPQQRKQGRIRLTQVIRKLSQDKHLHCDRSL